MRQTDFARARHKLATIAIAALVLSGCLEQEKNEGDGFTGTNQPLTNTAPVISGNPATAVQVGTMYSFAPSASDADGDTLTFSIQNQPSWADFISGSGELSGQPTLGDLGTHSNIRISVSDGTASVSLPTFSISVTQEEPDNRAPSIMGTPPTSVTAGMPYSFVPTASDPENDALSFSISALPGWASFDATTGELAGTPQAEHAGVYPGIVIGASDGEFTDSLPAFTITVAVPTPNNTPPTISGTPAVSVDAGSAYSFTPTADDADGDSLSFSVGNLPSWAGFNTSSGALTGTPTDNDVGDYANITITASDGIDNATLGPFSITVNPVTLGSATLSWAAPTQNEDGTDLVDLAGYRLYWGTTPGEYTDSVTIDNPGITTYVIENLAPGTYEFVATSYNEAGVESIYSNPATKVVQ